MKKYISKATILSFLFLIGCASGAKVSNMVVPPQESGFVVANDDLKENIHVTKVDGGQETNPLWKSKIGNQEFKLALLQSLKDAKYLGTPENSNYHLSANLIEVDQPFAGVNLTVTTTVEYILIEQNSEKIILKESITASYTAGFDDSVIAVKRLRLANEGSARENIYEFLKVLSDLKIESQHVSIKIIN